MARRLELDRLQLVGGPHLVRLPVGDDLGVAHLLAGLAVDDLAVRRPALGRRHAHHRGTRVDQRDAAGRAGTAHRVEVHAHRPRAASDQCSEHGVVVLRVVVGQRDAHLVPVGLELLGHDLRHRARDVLAHLGLADHHGDDAVGSDRVPGRRAEGAGGERRADAFDRDIAEGEAGSRAADQEGTPLEIRNVCHGSAPRLGADVGRGADDGLLDSTVGHAAAEVAVHVIDDLLFGRIGILRQKRSGLHDLAGLAVATLRHLLGHPGNLQRMVAAEAFDGGDLLANRVLRRGLAGAHGDAVEMDGAGATETRAATEFRTSHLQVFADDPKQRRVVVDIDLLGLTVDGECEHVLFLRGLDAWCRLSRRAHRFDAYFLVVARSWTSVIPIVHSALNRRQEALFDISETVVTVR